VLEEIAHGVAKVFFVVNHENCVDHFDHLVN
jgi:hypothetical protein